MVFFLALAVTVYCIVMSLRTLFIPNTVKGKLISLENFLYLCFVYLTILIGFGLIYILLETKGYPILVEQNPASADQFMERLATFIYFSGITLFSVGYGDISPVGIGRLIVVIEALIGYAIPTAFVAQAVFRREHK